MRIETRVYKRIAAIADAYHRCIEDDNREWADKHAEDIRTIAEGWLPRGSGFDRGTTVDVEESSTTKLVLCTSYHHMDENGFYCGWTDHTITVTPNLAFDFDLDITAEEEGVDTDYIDIDYHLEYMYELFDFALRKPYTYGIGESDEGQ